MSYTTLQSLVDTYGIAEVAALLCDEDRLVTEDLLRDKLAADVGTYSAPEQEAIAAAVVRAENALARQSIFIDSKIAARYTLPLTDAASTPVVECCLALTRAALADDGDNITKTIKEERAHWRSWLKQVVDGSALLPGEVAGNQSGVVSQRQTGAMCSGLDWDSY